MTPIKNPILLDIPESFETERLIIRPPRFGDGRIVNAAIRESIKELQPWMPWAQQVPEPDETEAIFRRKIAQWTTREDFLLVLWRKTDGAVVGGSGLHRIDWSVPRMEIGYWARTSMSGHGYITEAVLGITAFAFETLGAQRIEIRCDARNIRSAAVAERAGYTREACLRHSDRGVDGSLRDTLIYAMFPPE